MTPDSWSLDHDHEAIGEALKRLHTDRHVKVEGPGGRFYSYEEIRVTWNEREWAGMTNGWSLQLRDPLPTRPFQPNGGRTMRRWFFAIAATLFAAVAMTPAGALPLGPAAMRPTPETANPVEQTACWRLARLGLVSVLGLV